MNSQSSHTAICQDCYDHFIISRSGSPRSRDVTRQQRGSTWSVPRTLHPCAATHAMNRAGPSQLAKTLTTSSTRFQPPSRQRVAWSNNNQQHSNERPGNYCYFLSSLCFFIIPATVFLRAVGPGFSFYPSVRPGQQRQPNHALSPVFTSAYHRPLSPLTSLV